MSLPPGQRKKAVLAAILLAWKEIPFRLGGRSLGSGFDSSNFVRFVLSQVGINIADEPNRRPSEIMMQRFERTDTPMPGDLMFYRGNIGNFVLIYLAKGNPGGQGICVGTVETGQPVQIIDSTIINTPIFPFIGYYKIDYSDGSLFSHLRRKGKSTEWCAYDLLHFPKCFALRKA